MPARVNVPTADVIQTNTKVDADDDGWGNLESEDQFLPPDARAHIARLGMYLEQLTCGELDR